MVFKKIEDSGTNTDEKSVTDVYEKERKILK